MLSIRPEQIEVFQDVAEAAFERRIADYLREEHADEVVTLPARQDEVREVEVKSLDDETLLAMVRAGIARARSHGMTWESSITAFVVLMFVVSPNFDSHRLIRRLLNDEETEPDARMDSLLELTTEENWEMAGRQYDAGAWNVAERG
jgi:hypothetical protein